MRRSSDRLNAGLMLILATALWSLSFATMKALSLSQQAGLPGASTWFIASLCATLRFGLAAVILGAWCLRKGSAVTRLELEQGIGLGLFGVAGIVLQMDGLAYTTASTSAFLTQCYCLLIPLWLAARSRRWPSPLVLGCCLLVLGGVAVLSRVDWHTLRLGRGELETVLASVFFTGQILWLERPPFRRNRVTHFSTVMFVVMALGALGLAGLSTRDPDHWFRAYATGASWGLMALLVVGCTLGGYLLMNHWQPRLGATEAGLIYCCEPLFVSLTAGFLPGWMGGLVGVNYPNESLDASVWLGGGLITLANVIVQCAPPPVAAAKIDRQPSSPG